MGGCYEASLKEDLDAMGIIPRVLRELFHRIEEHEDSDFLVKVSYLEVSHLHLFYLNWPDCEAKSGL